MVLSVTAIERATHACSPPAFPEVDHGFLGASAGASGAQLFVPRNFAVVGFVQSSVDGGTPEFAPVPDMPWSVPTTPFDPGVHFPIDGVEGVTTDAVDLAPPTAPVLRSTAVLESGDADRSRFDCGGVPRCGGAISTFDLGFDRAVDDIAPQQRLTYAVYAAETETAVMSSSSPRVLLAEIGPGQTSSHLGSLGVTSQSVFVAIEAVDQAGNRSARSAPMRLR